MARIVGLWVILFAIWLLLSGHWDSALLVGFGVGSCALTVYIANRMDVADHDGVSIYWVGRFLLYLPWLLKEILIANINVAKVILSPKLPISPIMVVLDPPKRPISGACCMPIPSRLPPARSRRGSRAINWRSTPSPGRTPTAGKRTKWINGCR